jgi:hypothetical protein
MHPSLAILIGGLVALLCFVLGVLAGRKWEMLNAPPDGPVEVFHTERYPLAQEIPPIATEPYKCAICGEDVKHKQHDGRWRCLEHKGI